MDSIWTKTCSFPSFPALEGEHHTDVLIIGGGIAGLLCAYNLQKKGIDYMVVDASRILSGTTNGTTGKITAFHGLIYHKLKKAIGLEKAGLYLLANLSAVKTYQELCRNIDCDWEEQNHYIYSLEEENMLGEELRDFTAFHYPNSKEICFWAAQDCMPLDSRPYIGPYASLAPGIYVASGFQKWGMTSSLLAAGILTDHILGKENPYSILFSPSRSILKPQLFFNGLESTKNLLTPSSPRCPHLGCALTWNKAEHSYDCPCHGSRFAKDGSLLNNPANKDLSWAAKKEQKHK